MRKSFVAKGIVVAALALMVGGTANAAGADDVLTGEGYKGVRLGMTTAEVQATGELGDLWWDNGSCDFYTSASRPADGKAITVSDNKGVVELRVPDSVPTQDGIGVGSTVADLKAKYPNASSYRNGFTVTVPGYTDRFYDFWVEGDEPFGDDAKIIKVGLNSTGYDC